MIFYGIASAVVDEILDFYPSRDAAEEELDALPVAPVATPVATCPFDAVPESKRPAEAGRLQGILPWAVKDSNLRPWD